MQLFLCLAIGCLANLFSWCALQKSIKLWRLHQFLCCVKAAGKIIMKTKFTLNSCLISCLMCPYFSNGLTLRLTLHLMSRCNIAKRDDLHTNIKCPPHILGNCVSALWISTKWQSPSPPSRLLKQLLWIKSSYTAKYNLQTSLLASCCLLFVWIVSSWQNTAQDRSSKQLLGLGSQCPPPPDNNTPPSCN